MVTITYYRPSGQWDKVECRREDVPRVARQLTDDHCRISTVQNPT